MWLCFHRELGVQPAVLYVRAALLYNYYYSHGWGGMQRGFELRGGTTRRWHQADMDFALSVGCKPSMEYANANVPCSRARIQEGIASEMFMFLFAVLLKFLIYQIDIHTAATFGWLCIISLGGTVELSLKCAMGNVPELHTVCATYVFRVGEWITWNYHHDDFQCFHMPHWIFSRQLHITL